MNSLRDQWRSTQDNPLFSFVELMPHGGHDGGFVMHEVLGLRLR